MCAPRDDLEPLPIESQPLKDRGDLVYDAVGRCHDYWRSVAGDDAIPLAQNFDLVEIAEIAGEVVILDVETPGLSFRFRMVGSDICDRYSVDPTGDLISDLPRNEFWETAEELCRRVVLERRPYWRPPLKTMFPDKSFIVTEGITLPLLNEIGDISRVVALIHFTN